MPSWRQRESTGCRWGCRRCDDETLAFLGRAHRVEESLAALDTAQRLFERVSIDLIYARPDQSGGQWEAELARAIGFGTTHMSLYQLTIEPGTRFATDVAKHQWTPLDDDAAADLYALTQTQMEAAGLPAYEISNHAAPGQESRHNLAYWRYQDYVGIGPGAHGRRLAQGDDAPPQARKFPERCCAQCAWAEKRGNS